MRTSGTLGTCYCCGCQLTPIKMKNHILKEHAGMNDEQECVLLKIEGLDEPDYWLYLDMPATSMLSSLDRFLRNIWCECCGHLSGFFCGRYEEVGKSHKIGAFPPKSKILYEYDFGFTTSLVITVIGGIKRPKQRNAVRLLARNDPFSYQCELCGSKAVFIDEADEPDERSIFYCEKCADEHASEQCLPITNSPRMGVCDYRGLLDKYVYVPQKTKE